eukprot:jgi/Bigna1/86087/estExt_fgenesh1_pg.C_80056
MPLLLEFLSNFEAAERISNLGTATYHVAPPPPSHEELATTERRHIILTNVSPSTKHISERFDKSDCPARVPSGWSHVYFSSTRDDQRNSIRHVMMPYTNERMGDNMKNSWFQMNPGSIRDHNKEYVEACTSIADAISTVEAHGRRNMLQSSIVSVPFLAKSAAMAAGLCLAQRGGYMTIHTDAMPPALKAMTKMYLGLGEEILRMSKKAAPVAENLYNSMVRKFLDETVKHLQL